MSSALSISPWILAARPRTLVAALAPVSVGTGLAFAHGSGRPWVAFAALIGAVLIQLGTNLTNDYYDYIRGADTKDRLGPARVTQQGLLAPRAVISGAGVCFGAALLVGISLVWVGGWPVVAIGLCSLLAGFAYTGGPYPLGYHGLGDAFVIVFFGFVAVVGTYYVQALTVHPLAFWAAMPVGALGDALLVVNNLRDRPTDALAGKRTLVVRFGERFGRVQYLVLMGVSFLTPMALWATGTSAWVLVPLLSFPLALAPTRQVLSVRGAILNQALASTARLLLAFGLLFAFGLWKGAVA